MNKKAYAVVIMLLIVIFSISYQVNNKIENMNSTILHMNNQLSSLNNEIYKMTFKMDKELEKDKLIQNIEFDIENTDSLYKEALVGIDLTFNKIAEDADVKFYYRNEKPEYENESIQMGEGIHEDFKVKMVNEIIYGDWQELQMTKTDAMNYIAHVQLSYEYNYQTKIVINDNNVFIAEETDRINLYYDTLLECWVDVWTMGISSDGDLTYHAEIAFNNYIKDIDIENVHIEAYNGDELIDEFELIDEKYMIDDHTDSYYRAERETTVEDIDMDKIFENMNYKAIVKDSLGRTFEYYNKR
ncbi:MAG: hypothetical protein KAH05_02235 [Clostridiales bacterium]|nr:hypothetical protein [Clostridiales bacterium]